LDEFVKLPSAFPSLGLFVIDIWILIKAAAENPAWPHYDVAKAITNRSAIFVKAGYLSFNEI